MRSHAGRAVAVAFALAVAAAMAAPACGSSGAGNTGGGSGSGGSGGSLTTTTTTTPMPPKGSCGQPGDKGNNNGVGTYCTPGGKQCEDFPLAGLCLADVGQDQWFCSRIGCDKNSDCGDDATCVKQQGSSGCVPNRCLDGTSTSSGGGAGGTSPTGSGGATPTGSGGSGGIITP